MLDRPKSMPKERGFALSDFGTQARNYTSLAIWLLIDCISGRKKKLSAAFALNLAYFGSQGIGLGAVYWYARTMQSDGRASVPWIGQYISVSDQALLWVVVILATVAFIASALFTYLSRNLILSMVQEHYAKSLEKLVFMTIKLPDSRAPLASRILRNRGFAKLAGGCRRAAIFAAIFCNAIFSMIGALGAAAFLFWADPLLTGLVLVALSLAALILYPLTLHASQLVRIREQAERSFREELASLNRERAPAAFTLTSPNEVSSAFIARKRIRTELNFRSEIGIALILAAVVAYMANQSLAGRMDWAFFIVYIGALRIVLIALTQGIRAFAGMSRFYPYLASYYGLLQELEGLEDRAFESSKRGDQITLGTLRTGEKIRAVVGERWAVAAIDAKDLQHALLMAGHVGSDLPLKSELIAPGDTVHDDTTLAILDLSKWPAGVDVEAVVGALKNQVTLMIGGEVTVMGSFGEKYLLTVLKGEFWRCAAIGSPETGVALEEFARRAFKFKKKALAEDEDEDEA
jgi:hypothetical protein